MNIPGTLFLSSSSMLRLLSLRHCMYSSIAFRSSAKFLSATSPALPHLLFRRFWKHSFLCFADPFCSSSSFHQCCNFDDVVLWLSPAAGNNGNNFPLLLPLSFLAVLVVVFSFIIAFIFFGINAVANEISDPFGCRVTYALPTAPKVSLFKLIQ